MSAPSKKYSIYFRITIYVYLYICINDYWWFYMYICIVHIHVYIIQIYVIIIPTCIYIYIYIRIGWYVHEENWIKKPNSVYVEDIYVDPDFFFKPGRLRHILDSRLYLEQDDFLTQPSTEHGNGKLIIYLYMVYRYAFPIWTSWKGFDIAMCEYGSLKGTNP